MRPIQEIRKEMFTEYAKKHRRHSEWADHVEELIAQQLEERVYVRDEDAELFRTAVQWKRSHFGDPPAPGPYEILRTRLFAHGWHSVELDENPSSALIWLGLMRRPVVVKVMDGESFEAPYRAGRTAEQIAEEIARDGVWRPHIEGWDFITPHRIVSIAVG